MRESQRQRETETETERDREDDNDIMRIKMTLIRLYHTRIRN